MTMPVRTRLTDLDDVTSNGGKVPSSLLSGPYGGADVKRDYGAKGDARFFADAATTNGSHTLTSATAAFTVADVGKTLIVQKAADGNSPLSVTVSAYVSATQVTLSGAAAGATLTGLTCTVGTDDTAAIQAAINAAVSAGGGEVFFPAGIYHFSRVVLPAVGYTAARGVGLKLFGPQPQCMAAAVQGSAFPTPTAGAILKSTLANGGSGSAFATPGSFTNIHLVLDKLTFRTTNNASATCLDLVNCSTCEIGTVVVDTEIYLISAMPAVLTGPVYGVALPGEGNGAFTYVKNLLVVGYDIGILLGEHALIENATVFGCFWAAYLNPFSHAVRVNRFGDFANFQGIRCLGLSRLDVAQWAIERDTLGVGGWTARSVDFYDPSNFARGTARFAVVQAGSGAVSTFSKTGGTSFTCTDIGE